MGAALKNIFLAFYVCLITATIASPITDPLPAEPYVPRSKSIKCPSATPIHWKETQPQGQGLSFSYTCGDKADVKVEKLSCSEGYKPTYRRDLIPEKMREAARNEISKRQSVVYNPEPDFGLFSSGAKPDVLDSASIIYVCIKGKQ